MEILAYILILGGLILYLTGKIWFLAVVFKENVIWGFGCLLIPVLSFVYFTMYWKETAKPFDVAILGLIILFTSTFLFPDVLKSL